MINKIIAIESFLILYQGRGDN